MAVTPAGEGLRSPLKLGINGLGRIGKLTLWHHVARGYFAELVVNIGRQAGKGLEDIARYIERDSTYGSLGKYLLGFKAGRVIENLEPASSEAGSSSSPSAPAAPTGLEPDKVTAYPADSSAINASRITHSPEK